MDNQINQDSAPHQDNPVEIQKVNQKPSSVSMIIVSSIAIISLVLSWYLVYQNLTLQKQIVQYSYPQPPTTPTIALATPTPSVATITPSIVLTLSPTATPTIVATPTDIPTPTPTTKLDDYKLIHTLIANFEKYNATQNTAGALQYFTAPVSTEDKNKLSQIRSLNTPYRISSWYFTKDNNEASFLNTPIDHGYRIMMSEVRDGIQYNFYLDIVRIEDQFFIDRYFHTTSINSASSLKYEGFDL